MECFLFDGLLDQEKQLAFSFFERQEKLKKGDDLYLLGALGFLVEGSAKIKRQSENGESITVRNIRSGELFGSASLFGSWNKSFSNIIAESTCVCLYINEEKFQELLLKFPVVSLNYIAYLTEKIRFLNRRLDTFSADSAEQKVYEYLLSVCDDNGQVILNIPKAELARRLKIGRTSLYRCLDSLEKNHLISQNESGFLILSN